MFIILIGTTIFMLKIYKIRPEGKMIVIYGAGGTRCVADSKGAVVYPVLQQYFLMPSVQMFSRINFENEGAKYFAELAYRIGRDKEMLAAAAENFMNYEKLAKESFVDKLILEVLKNIIGTETCNSEGEIDRKITRELGNYGLEVLTFENSKYIKNTINTGT